MCLIYIYIYINYIVCVCVYIYLMCTRYACDIMNKIVQESVERSIYD